MKKILNLKILEMNIKDNKLKIKLNMITKENKNQSNIILYNLGMIGKDQFKKLKNYIDKWMLKRNSYKNNGKHKRGWDKLNNNNLELYYINLLISYNLFKFHLNFLDFLYCV